MPSKKCTSFQDLKEKQLLQNLNFAGLSIHQLMFIQNKNLESALIPCHNIGKGQFKNKIYFIEIECLGHTPIPQKKLYNH